MKRSTRLLSIFSLLILASLVFAPAAQAFDGRSDDRIVIGKDEVINDDLYLAGSDIIIDGTVNGDLMAAGNTVVVNGSVTGDLWAAGRTVTVNGQVGDDLFAAAAAVTLGPDASIADDVFSSAASVETQPGSTIGGELMIGAFQGLVSGDVIENLPRGRQPPAPGRLGRGRCLGGGGRRRPGLHAQPDVVRAGCPSHALRSSRPDFWRRRQHRR